MITVSLQTKGVFSLVYKTKYNFSNWGQVEEKLHTMVNYCSNELEPNLHFTALNTQGQVVQSPIKLTQVFCLYCLPFSFEL